MSYIEVCKLDDLTPYSGQCALVNDKQVALFRMDESDSIYAVGNYDPIGKANVLSRGIIGEVNGEKVIASPLYKQHFNLKTGQCIQEDVSIPVYDVKIESGIVLIAA